jgi:outer membrane protein OmpA-like peptidoglycan-associated protein
MIKKTLLSSLMVILVSGCVSTSDFVDNSNNKNLNQEYSLIKFDKNKSNIKKENSELLINSQRILAHYPESNINIEGRASTEGSDEYNMNLSEERTSSTMNYLEKKGINKERIRSNFFGESSQIPSDKNKLKVRNRSVKINIESN